MVTRLPWHAQLSVALDGAEVQDLDIIRLPQALPHKTASCVWSALALGSGGLGPGNLFARADYPCVVITCDQATANIKLLKHLHARSPSQRFLLPMLCAQHRNGNVVEQITKLLGILPGSYCWAKCSSKGNFLKDLKDAVKKQLEQDLVILIEEPPGVQAEWSQAKKQAKLLACGLVAPPLWKLSRTSSVARGQD